MIYKRFLEITQKNWNDYFKMVEEKFSQGILKATLMNGEKAKILYPNILLITRTKRHYLVELLGASDTFKGLKMKVHKETSIARYLNQFNTNESHPVFATAKDDSRGISFRDLTVSHHVDFELLMKRFPFFKLLKTVIPSHPDASGALFSVGKNCRDIVFDNCFLVNRYINSVRVKHLLHLTIINKEMSALEYNKWLEGKLQVKENLPGFHLCDSQFGRILTIASQFASTCLFYGLRETTIGEFLNQHHEIIQKAVGGRNIIYEPHLKWIEKSPENTDKAINPDLMIERGNGFYDIYDLKTALLNKTSLTKGKRSRRDFISYVRDGVSQLANYEEYFKSSKNCEYALNEYGIRVKAPNLVLVVGNFDNVNKTEIEEASRQLKDSITIIDYDSFLQLFLSRKNESQP